MPSSCLVEGKRVKVGDWVGFKCDIEQGGVIKAIVPSAYRGYDLVLENKNGFIGDYIGGETLTTQPADRCWID